MPLPKEDWDKLYGSVEAIKNANCNATTVFENNSVTVDDIRNKYKTTPDDAWLKPVDEKILASNPDETCGLSGEALEIVKANPPISPTPTPLTPTEKTSALRTISYTEKNMGYLKTQTSRNPMIAKKVEGLSASLSDVKKEVVADPPSRPLGLARYHRRRQE